MTNEAKAKIRPMTRDDLEAVIDIDQAIRREGTAMTYVNITTARVFSAKASPVQKSPGSNGDTIKEAFARLLNLGFVAEVEGKVRAFILGRVAKARTSSGEVGTIAILGVHPYYQRRGLATRLVEELKEKFRTEKVMSVRIARRDVHHRDTPLLDFIDAMRH
ncbi:MAG: GNAT family N-acetyltransferase [Dehalococcoidia bacterium]|nr:MAG: GNAT family N-acetyltransferase [Dehalococcoidia bacterium]